MKMLALSLAIGSLVGCALGTSRSSNSTPSGAEIEISCPSATQAQGSQVYTFNSADQFCDWVHQDQQAKGICTWVNEGEASLPGDTSSVDAMYSRLCGA